MMTEVWGWESQPESSHSPRFSRSNLSTERAEDGESWELLSRWEPRRPHSASSYESTYLERTYLHSQPSLQGPRNKSCSSSAKISSRRRTHDETVSNCVCVGERKSSGWILCMGCAGAVQKHAFIMIVVILPASGHGGEVGQQQSTLWNGSSLAEMMLRN